MLGVCLYAAERVADKADWQPEYQTAAAIVTSTGPSARLALALRSNVFLKNMWSDIVRNSGLVGDKASSLLQ